jgi:hypothetical protein
MARNRARAENLTTDDQLYKSGPGENVWAKTALVLFRQKCFDIFRTQITSGKNVLTFFVREQPPAKMFGRFSYANNLRRKCFDVFRTRTTSGENVLTFFARKQPPAKMFRLKSAKFHIREWWLNIEGYHFNPFFVSDDLEQKRSNLPH